MAPSLLNWALKLAAVALQPSMTACMWFVVTWLSFDAWPKLYGVEQLLQVTHQEALA